MTLDPGNQGHNELLDLTATPGLLLNEQSRYSPPKATRKMLLTSISPPSELALPIKPVRDTRMKGRDPDHRQIAFSGGEGLCVFCKQTP